MTKIQAGTWVEIEEVILKPEERAPSLPEDTKKVPYLLRVSGFLVEEAEMGEVVHIRTIIGRELKGVLRTIQPCYRHSFGTVRPKPLANAAESEKRARGMPTRRS